MAADGPSANTLGNPQEIPLETNPKRLATKLSVHICHETEVLVDGILAKAKSQHLKGVIINEDPEVEIFIQAKLREWDKNESGDFNREEILAVMEEWRMVNTQRRKLKLKIGIGSAGVTVSFLMMFLALAVAFIINRNNAPEVASTAWGSEGQRGATFQARDADGHRDILVTDERRTSDTDLNHVLAFDDASDSWAISDQKLREVDSVSFSHGDAVFHLSVAHLVRTDSGPSGSSDGVEIWTAGGHRIRYWENTTTLDVKWFGTSAWFEVDMQGEDARRMSEALPHGPPDIFFIGPGFAGTPVVGASGSVTYDSAPEPPRGRRAKGYVAFYGGTHFGRATDGSSYTQDECYRINQSHYYCKACGLSKMAGLLCVMMALLTQDFASLPPI